jgi:hypothetical protein
VAQLELRERVTKAKRKGTEIIDQTPVFDFPHAKLSQLEWHEGAVRKAWFTSSAKIRASEVMALALARPEFSKLEGIGIGLQCWPGPRQKDLDEVFDVLEASKVRLSEFAYGDYVNESGVIIEALHLERLERMSPKLKQLRITTSGWFPNAKPLETMRLESLESLWFRSNRPSIVMHQQLDRAWPKLTSLGVGWHWFDGNEQLTDWAWLIDGNRVPQLRNLTLIGSTLWHQLLPAMHESGVLAKLDVLDLRSKADPDRELWDALRKNEPIFEHLKALILPPHFSSAASDFPRLKVQICGDRSQFVDRG